MNVRLIGCFSVALLGLIVIAQPALGSALEEGTNLYASRCAFCHGASGKGDGPAGRALKPPPTDLTSADFWAHQTPATIREIIENGKPGTSMLAYKGSLRAEQVDQLLTYLETFRPPASTPRATTP